MNNRRKCISYSKISLFNTISNMPKGIRRTMYCKNCKKLEIVVGGDTLEYYCNCFKVFIDASVIHLMGRFCIRFEEENNGNSQKM